LFVKYKVERKQIQQAVAETDVHFRRGFTQLFNDLSRHDIPTLIFSAGLAGSSCKSKYCYHLVSFPSCRCYTRGLGEKFHARILDTKFTYNFELDEV